VVPPSEGEDDKTRTYCIVAAVTVREKVAVLVIPSHVVSIEIEYTPGATPRGTSATTVDWKLPYAWDGKKPTSIPEVPPLDDSVTG